MEAALQAVPTIASLSDVDSYNLEHAQLRLAAFTEALEQPFTTIEESPPLPTPDDSPSRHSSPTPPPAILATEAEESEDVARVEELIGGGDVLEALNDLDDEIPFSAEYVDDEPSSVLALRISRAMDNPSPPPSPLTPLDELEPTAPEASPAGSEQSDSGDGFTPPPHEDTVSSDLLPSVPGETVLQPESSIMEVDTTQSGNLPPQADLISFDSFTTSEVPPENLPLEQENTVPDSAVSAVDALLLVSPSTDGGEQPTSATVEAATVDEMSESGGIVPSSEISEITPPPSTPPTTQTLRRSPRKSVVPTPIYPDTPNGPSTPRSSTSRSPRKKKPKIEEIVEDSQDEGDIVVDSALLPIQPVPVGTPRAKERSRSRSPLVFSREVGSLSPTTSNLLTQLIPSFTDTTPLHLNTTPEVLIEPTVSSEGMQSFSVFSSPLDPQPSTPQRPSTSVRPAETPSPSKLRTQLSVQDMTATPARRIPIEEAIASGQLSPAKAAQMGFTPRALASTPQTPARRVFVYSDEAAQAPPSTKRAVRSGSPIRGRSQEPTSRMATLSNMNKTMTPSFQRPVAAMHSTLGFPSTSSNSGKSSKLPFPLVTSQKTPSTSAANNKDVSKELPSISSPVKSTLKQPTSRIPRIGTKPYSRPPVLAKPTTSKPAPPAPKPTMRKVDLSKPSAPMVANRGLSSSTSLAKSKGKEAMSIRPIVPAGSAVNATSSATSAIKRKRGADKVASPVKSRMPSSRQVPTIASTSTSRVRTPTPVAVVALAPKKAPATTVRIKKVIVNSTPNSSQLPPAPISAPAPAFQRAAQPQPQQVQLLPSVSAVPPVALGTEPPLVETAAVEPEDALGSPMKEDAPAPITAAKPPPVSLIPPPSQVVQIPTIHIDPPMETPPIETLPPPPTGVRRTTRQRKSVSLIDPVVPEPTSRASSSRRKAPQGPRLVFTDAYSEMSVTALKQLTATNTVRNQHYLSARLEVEVIRKDGLRPESPMVKIKTIAQRQMEQQVEKRSERAQRRARRSGEVPGSSDLEMDSDDEDNLSGEDELPNIPPMQHTRGAGEDEDYETPHRAFKRMKLTEDGAQDEDMIEKRRSVRWDKGLYTTVYLDEVVLGSRQPVKELPNLKGCLAPAAKALRLDTLGNLGGNDTSLPEFVPQHVTVKKFVYEGEVVPELVVEAPELAPKVTRSKSKKAKS